MAASRRRRRARRRCAPRGAPRARARQGRAARARVRSCRWRRRQARGYPRRMPPGPSLSLADHAVLITGGARRLGAAIARLLHPHGANILIHYRGSRAEAERLADELNRVRSHSAALYGADLLDLDALPGIVAATLAAFGRLDVLVNNASTFYPTPLGAVTPAAFEDLIGSNLRAPLFLTQAAASALRLRRGLVLNMVDIHAFRPLKRHPVYSAAKAGLVML